MPDGVDQCLISTIFEARSVLHFQSPQPSDRDVLATGLGMVTPLGLSREASWQTLTAGLTAARHLTRADVSHFDQLCDLMKAVPAGAPVDRAVIAQRAADVVTRWTPKLASDFQRHFSHDCLNNMVAVSLMEALDDAELSVRELHEQRIGCVIGSSKASLQSTEAEYLDFRRHGSKAALADEISMGRWQHAFLPDATLGCVKFLTQSEGPGNCPVAACATGLISVIEAAHYISSGQCDICIAGSADASLRASVLASFHRLGVLSRHTPPAMACRPFDINRDGFVIGEGAAVVILESRQHAERRGAESYAQIVSGGWLTDPTGMTQIDSEGRIVSQLIRQLIRQLTSAHVPAHVQLHGTGTETNDLAEANGLNRIYGADQLPVCSASKGATGHLLGAAGSVEFGFTLLGLRDQIIPGTRNHLESDPRCHVNLLQHTASPSSLHSAMKLSLGFGGHVAGCVIRPNVSK